MYNRNNTNTEDMTYNMIQICVNSIDIYYNDATESYRCCCLACLCWLLPTFYQSIRRVNHEYCARSTA